MRVLVACEFSGVVRREFAALGHDVMSCDLLPSEDDSPFHYVGDVRDLLAEGGRWDLMIAHPPCTDVASSGARYHAAKIADGRQARAVAFVRFLMDAPVERVAVENPIGVLSTQIRRPDQIVQPWQFGDDASKATCLWLRNLPPLKPTNVLPGGAKARRANQTASGQNRLGPSADRWKLRSRTYAGIAEAMAAQWGGRVEVSA